MRLGTETVSKEEGQGVKQTGGTIVEPCLEQDKDNILEIGARTVVNRCQYKVGNRRQNSSRIGPETGSEIGSRIGLKTGFEPVFTKYSSKSRKRIGSLQCRQSFISLKGTRCVTLYHGLRIDQSLTVNECSRTGWISSEQSLGIRPN